MESLVVTKQPPEEWYNQRGSSKEGFKTVLEYRTPDPALSATLQVNLFYADGKMVDDTILKIVGTWNPLVPSNKPIVLESRITQVSKSHGGKKFCLRIVAKNSQGLYCTAPVFTTPICVKSKPRPEKRTRADDRKRDLQQLAAQAIDLIRRYQWIPVGYETNAADNARNDLNRPILECPECKVCYRASSSDPPPHAASCKFRALLEDADALGLGDTRPLWARLREDKTAKQVDPLIELDHDAEPYPGAQAPSGTEFALGATTLCNMLNGSVYNSWFHLSQAIMSSHVAAVDEYSWAEEAAVLARSQKPKRPRRSIEDDVFYIAAENYKGCGCIALSQDYELLGFYIYKGMELAENWISEEDLVFVKILTNDNLDVALFNEIEGCIKTYKQNPKKILFGLGDYDCKTLKQLKTYVYSKLSKI